MLEIAINLIATGRGGKLFYFITETEYQRAANMREGVCERERTELLIAKELIGYTREEDARAIYALLTYACSDETRNALVPQYMGRPWRPGRTSVSGVVYITPGGGRERVPPVV